MVYGGERKTTQFQAIPPAAQLSPLQCRRRDRPGARLRAASTCAGTLAAAWPAGPSNSSPAWPTTACASSARATRTTSAAPGAAALGVQGRLRRERAQRGAQPRSLRCRAPGGSPTAGRWRPACAAARCASSRRTATSSAPTATTAAARASPRPCPWPRCAMPPTPDLALYASAGRGFETPTLNELSYRPDGTGGLNFALQPSVNDSVEVGAKARLAGGLLTAALFQTRTSDEIVTDTNIGGRATFQNAGQHPARRLRARPGSTRPQTTGAPQLAYTWLDARYSDAFCSPSPCKRRNTVPAGNRIPGIAPQALLCRLRLGAARGLARRRRAARARQHRGQRPQHRQRARLRAGGAVRGLLSSAGSAGSSMPSRASTTCSTEQYIGSVIVNEGNGALLSSQRRSATGRSGMGAAYRF